MNRIPVMSTNPMPYQAIRRRNDGGGPSFVSSYSAALKCSASRRSMTSSSARPAATNRWRVGSHSSTRLALVHPEHRQERFLRDLDGPDPLHPLLAFLLLLEQLPLPGDIATVTLGKHVLPHRPDRFPGNDVASDRRLDGDLEHLARDQLLEPLGQVAPDRLGLVAVDDHRQRVDRLAVDEDVDLGKVRRAVAQLLVVHRGVALAAALEL